jgi:hypothetical protein
MSLPLVLAEHEGEQENWFALGACTDGLGMGPVLWGIVVSETTMKRRDYGMRMMPNAKTHHSRNRS